jgi:GTPase KRas protein
MAEFGEFKVVVLGSGGVGKTSLTIRLITDNFLEDYNPTIQVSLPRHMIPVSPAAF